MLDVSTLSNKEALKYALDPSADSETLLRLWTHSRSPKVRQAIASSPAASSTLLRLALLAYPEDVISSTAFEINSLFGDDNSSELRKFLEVFLSPNNWLESLGRYGSHRAWLHVAVLLGKDVTPETVVRLVGECQIGQLRKLFSKSLKAKTVAISSLNELIDFKPGQVCPSILAKYARLGLISSDEIWQKIPALAVNKHVFISDLFTSDYHATKWFVEKEFNKLSQKHDELAFDNLVCFLSKNCLSWRLKLDFLKSRFGTPYKVQYKEVFLANLLDRFNKLPPIDKYFKSSLVRMLNSNLRSIYRSSAYEENPKPAEVATFIEDLYKVNLLVPIPGQKRSKKTPQYSRDLLKILGGPVYLYDLHCNHGLSFEAVEHFSKYFPSWSSTSPA